MIDLDALGAVLGLPEASANPLGHRAAVALERRHRPGVRLVGRIEADPVDDEVTWRERAPGAAVYEDMNRVTEEGAEALALFLACSKRSWRIERRLQSRLGEGADWLMVDRSSGAEVVLEIGGTDEQGIDALLARKIEQVRRSPLSERGIPAACVVRFLEPSIHFWIDHEPRRPEP